MTIIIFILGAAIGSFLNVCIYRLPRKLSVVSPGSACPNCRNPIPFYQNIPVLSYILLRGKCANCGYKIPIHYFAVEIFSGLIALFNYTQFGLTPLFPAYTILAFGLVVVTGIDIKTNLILNKVLIIILSIGLLLNIVFPFIAWDKAVLGFLSGGITMYLIALMGKSLFKKESLGMGDVKLAGVVGFFLGWLYILISIYLGFLLAFIVLIFMGRLKKNKLKSVIPLGPFLSLAFMVFVYWGDAIIHYYVIHFLR